MEYALNEEYASFWIESITASKSQYKEGYMEYLRSCQFYGYAADEVENFDAWCEAARIAEQDALAESTFFRNRQ